MLINISKFTRHLASLVACLVLIAMLTPIAAPSIALASEVTRKSNEPQGKTVVVPDGTELTAITTEEISSKTAAENDPVEFKVDEDVVVDGKVVIAKGATVKGTISESERAGRMGRSGKLNVRVESTTSVDNQKIKLRAAKNGKGGDKTGSVIALSLLVSPLFLLKHGKEAKVKAGTKIKVYTDEKKEVVIK
jgi:hypothetical protein